MDASAAPMKILPCKCSGTEATKYQDQRYGKGMRAQVEGNIERILPLADGRKGLSPKSWPGLRGQAVCH